MVDEIKVFDREITALEAGVISGTYQSEILHKEFSELTETQKKDRYQYYLANYDSQVISKLQELEGLRKQQNLLSESIFEVMVMDEMPQPRQAFVLERGVYNQPNDSVEPWNPGQGVEIPGRAATESTGTGSMALSSRQSTTLKSNCEQILAALFWYWTGADSRRLWKPG